MSNSKTNTRSTEQQTATAAPRKAALKVRTRVRAGFIEDDNTREAH